MRDRRLLYELDLDCRQPISRLASKLGMSKQLVSYRMSRLEEKGVIKGYSTMIDPDRLGFLQLRSYVRLRRADEAKTKEIMDFLKAEKRVWAVARMAGPADIVVVSGVRKTPEYRALWKSLEDKFKQWIASSKVSIYSPIYHFSGAYLVDARDESQPRVFGGAVVEVDDTDLKILKILSQNARAEAVKIAKEARIDAETVSERIKKLREKGVIQGYRAIIDTGRLGYEFYKADFTLTNTLDWEKMREYCRQEPSIYQLNEAIGGADLEVEFHVKSISELLSKIEGMKKAFPGVIENFDQYRFLNIEKLTYFPE